jgi:hypothetical protein
MSRANKVNKDHYTQRGRLTPDELARERARQIHLVSTKRRFHERTRQVTAQRDAQASTRDQTEREEEE